MLAELTMALAVIGLVAYAVLGGADLGSGFWDLTAGGARRGARVREMVHRSMSPVWEANHVWLIFVLVILWTGFPVAFSSIISTMAVPIFLAGVGIILRGSAFVFRGEAATIAQQRFFGATFAASSVMVPFFLGAAVGGVASGRVPVGNAAGDLLTSWWNPTSVLTGALAVSTGAYLAAVYLAADSTRAGLPDLVRAFRWRALVAGAVSGLLAFFGLAVVRSDARALFDGLTQGWGVVAVIASAIFGCVTLALVWTSRFGIARITAAGAVAMVAGGWVIAQRPDILPGELRLDDAAAGNATLTAVLASVAVGLLVLGPALWYLYRLVLRGRLDQEFRPLTTGDPPQ